MRRGPIQTVALLAAAGAVACPLPALAGPVRVGETQGLGLFGPDVPDVLKRAKADPYAEPADCAAAQTELAALNETLGPDADQPQPKTNQAAKLVTKAIRGLIPHKDVVRFLTGAGRKEGALQQAAMAGWARRGFLKGVSNHLCAAEQDQQLASAAVPAPDIDTRPLDVPPLLLAADTAGVAASDTAPGSEGVGPAPALDTVDAPETGAVAVNP